MSQLSTVRSAMSFPFEHENRDGPPGAGPTVVPPSVVGGAVKRVMDLGLALVALPFVLPLALAMAVLIRLETPGSPIFRQTRVGRNGRPFTIYKLRTMVQGAERLGAGIYAEANDARFTRVGTFARKFSLDELPQLLNVLKGDMSIVGPRPMLPVTVKEYAADYAVILRVRPGITGLAQVSGRNELPRRARLELDKKYVVTQSMWGDIRIVARTVRVALSGDGQQNTQTRADVER